MTSQARAAEDLRQDDSFPDNPVLVRVRRAQAIDDGQETSERVEALAAGGRGRIERPRGGARL